MQAIIIRPKECKWCTHIYYGFKHIVDEAKKLGIPVIDLDGPEAVKETIFKTIEEHPDYNCIFGTGHGSSTIYTAEHMQPVFTIENCGILKDKNVFLHSCLTANRLGPEAIVKGAESYCGYTIEWAWTFTEGKKDKLKYPDPYDDPNAKYFFMSANTYPITLIKTGSTSEALKATKEVYDHWIDYLFEHGGKEAAQIIGLLALDRDGTVLLGKDIVKIVIRKSITTQILKYSLFLSGLVGFVIMFGQKI